MNHCSRDYVNIINQDDWTRREFVVQQVAVKDNTDGAMLVQNEVLSEEHCGTVDDDATSQSSIDIRFPPPIPPQTPDMFLVQTCEPTDHTTIRYWRLMYVYVCVIVHFSIHKNQLLIHFVLACLFHIIPGDV